MAGGISDSLTAGHLLHVACSSAFNRLAPEDIVNSRFAATPPLAPASRNIVENVAQAQEHLEAIARVIEFAIRSNSGCSTSTELNTS